MIREALQTAKTSGSYCRTAFMILSKKEAYINKDSGLLYYFCLPETSVIPAEGKLTGTLQQVFHPAITFSSG
jgi:hypothetical protein